MPPSIIEFVTDPQLLGLSLSPAQETLLRAVYGLSLASEDQRALGQLCTGREAYPGRAFAEATVSAGARARKDSRIAAPVVCYEAIFGGHERYLARGERGVIPLVAQDQRATRIAFGYIRDYVTRTPLLAPLVAEVFTSEITLTNGLTIACFPCTLRSLRGWSIPAGVMDEVAFYRLEAGKRHRRDDQHPGVLRAPPALQQPEGQRRRDAPGRPRPSRVSRSPASGGRGTTRRSAPPIS